MCHSCDSISVRVWVVCLESVGGFFEKQNHHKISQFFLFFHTFSSLFVKLLCKRKENSHNSNNVVVGRGTREEKGWFDVGWVGLLYSDDKKGRK